MSRVVIADGRIWWQTHHGWIRLAPGLEFHHPRIGSPLADPSPDFERWPRPPYTKKAT